MTPEIISQNLDNITISMDNLAKLASAYAPSPWPSAITTMVTTAIAAAMGSVGLYFWQRYDKKKQIENSDNDKKIKNLNLLLLNLLHCIKDQNNNRIQILEHKKIPFKKFMSGTSFFEAYGECDLKIIKSSVLELISDFPEISFELNELEHELSWIKAYREQLNTLGRKEINDEKRFLALIERESNLEMHIIRKLVPVILAIYDYAKDRFPDKKILNIFSHPIMITSWVNLDNDKKFIPKNIFKRLQYEFKNKSIEEYFFQTLRNEYKNNPDVQERLKIIEKDVSKDA